MIFTLSRVLLLLTVNVCVLTTLFGEREYKHHCFYYFWLCWVFVAARTFLSLWHVGAALCCRVWASHRSGFSCCGAWALGAGASVVAAHGLSSCASWTPTHGLNSCGAWASLLLGMWLLPGPGIEPVSPAWQVDSLTLSHQGNPTITFKVHLKPSSSHLLCSLLRGNHDPELCVWCSGFALYLCQIYLHPSTRGGLVLLFFFLNFMYMKYTVYVLLWLV